MTARYLYEHYFLAHINFLEIPMEFYELVRSSTSASQPIEVIPTLRPFDDPGKTFYYRFRRIHSTIVHKTHMVVKFNDNELTRVNELFIEPQWLERPHDVGYESEMSANPFRSFSQIPVRSRYQFLLDHNHYIIMTFIRGPVCRGQMALNSIHDHFWVMFQDPDYDLTVQNPNFLIEQADNLRMPIESVSESIFKSFSDEYRNKGLAYYKAKEALTNKVYPKGFGIDAIWKGNRPEDSPLLTINRHFDSASVNRGVMGELTRTMWVLDYPHIERLYYALVAGYDVYGNLSHQLNARRYMDFLRIEGEANFVAYMPENKRLDILKSWYIGDDDIEDMTDEDRINTRPTQVLYKTDHPKSEFIEQVVNHHILKSTGIAFDDINYYKQGEQPPKMPTEFSTAKDIQDGARSLTAPGTGFMEHLVDHDLNMMHIRVINPDGESTVFTLNINRWHDNANSMFTESKQLDSSKDTIDFLSGMHGSYINVFGIVNYVDLPDFYDMIANFDGSDTYKAKIHKYFISRSDEKFWETFDWFQNYFNESEPLTAGLYDLNRYYSKPF
ncbi:MAG: peptidylprolyl isomerase [Epsilonproteobacteria bacterium]|nr:MAG: peptidylprolyl isomerase [Campylobacterota bacterium]